MFTISGQNRSIGLLLKNTGNFLDSQKTLAHQSLKLFHCVCSLQWNARKVHNQFKVYYTLTLPHTRKSAVEPEDFRDLDPAELSTLASYLAILATELARKAPEPAAHEDMIPDAPEDGSL